MAFNPEPTRTPTDIRDMEIRLVSIKDPSDDSITKSARFEIQIIYNTGEIKVISGDLVPHLTAGQISSLNSFMDALRTQAEGQILP